MIEEIIISTGTKHNVEEIKTILKDLNIKVIPMTDFPSCPKTVEDGKTLQENASKKAKEAAMFFKRWAMAHDTGLEVDYLNGAPGVYSARYAGENCSYEDNNKKLLKELKGVPKEKRSACFKCIIAVSSPSGEISLAEGKIFGTINDTLAGNKGFGYDPIFFVPEENKTFAELDPEIKNKISHRGKALQKVKDIVKRLSARN